MKKILAISDLHGNLPDIPPCDILLIAGDICPDVYRPLVMHQIYWLREQFKDWLERIPAKHVVATWGNHDWVGQEKNIDIPQLPWSLLIDEAVTIEGIKIWGTPWQLPFYDWAFNLPEEKLAEKYSLIPVDTDIVISHGPPYQFGDKNIKGEHCGSISLHKRIFEIKPKLTVFGHIHEDRGTWNLFSDTMVLANVAHQNLTYTERYPPVEFLW